MNIEVQIAENYMSAHIFVRVGEKESISELTGEKIYSALQQKGVTTGIDENAVDKIISNNICNQPVRVADGVPPESGENARVEILKKPKRKKDITPPQTGDGGIDYYSPREGFLVYAKKGETVAVKYPPTEGEPGKNVFGRTIPGLLGKQIALELFRGKNTIIKDDKIIADADGIIELAGLQINILDVYEIEDNVGNNTGSIDLPQDLNCKLVIKGDVQSGYKVSCSDLYVLGCIEDAVIDVKNLEVKEGIVGVGKQKVTAKNIKVGYINGSREIYSNTIIVLREISQGAKVYSNVVKAYAIQGSTVVARDAIWTDYANGNNSITVGIDYEVKLQHNELQKKILGLSDPLEELKNLDFLNTKRMKKLAELARINPSHPMLQKELPKIREAKIKLDNYLKLRVELIRRREELASKIIPESEPLLFVRSNFGKDSSVANIVEPNTTIILKDQSQKILDMMPGGLFTIGPHGITHTSRYNIKEIQSEFGKYFESSKRL